MSEVELLGEQFERLTVATNLQLYRQVAGLKYNTEKLDAIREKMTHVCEEFLGNYTKPRLMYLTALGSLAQAARIPHRLKLAEQRLAIISTPKYLFRNRPVTWASWRQFAAQNESSRARKEVFDHFVKQAPRLIPYVRGGFEAIREVYAKYGRSPLDNYLELEGLTYSNLTQMILKIGQVSKPVFLKAVNHFSQEIKQEPYEYYDDFYYYRSRIYTSLDKHLLDLKVHSAVRKVLTSLGFDVDRIRVDAKDRPKKSPSPFCYAIQVPNDVRVVYKNVSPGSNLGSIFHEFGHGIHGISGDINDPPWKRYVIPRSVAETFSFLIESLVNDPLFLREELHLPSPAVREIIDRRLFMQLFFVVFYSANSLMKLSFWRDGLSYEEASQYWQELTRKFFIETPGDYWLLHHIMSDYDIYAPSYLVAAIRVASLKKHLRTEYGERWWHSSDAGRYIQHLAATRGEFPTHIFPLDTQLFLKELKTISFL